MALIKVEPNKFQTLLGMRGQVTLSDVIDAARKKDKAMRRLAASGKKRK